MGFYFNTDSITPSKGTGGGGGGSEEVIEAINNTGATINADDKVYVAPLTTPQSGANYEIVPVKTTDSFGFGFYTANNSSLPTINLTEKSASDFSASKYLTIPKVFDYSHPWEFNICLQTGYSVSGEQYIYFGSTSTFGDGGLTIQTYEDKFYIDIHGVNVGRITIFHSYPIVANTTYYVCIGWTGTEYYARYSTDGTNWTDETPVLSSIQVIQLSPAIRIGSRQNFDGYFLGKIFLDKTYFVSDGEIVWQAMYDGTWSNIGKDVTTGIASETITSGSVGDVSGGGTGSIPVIEELNVTPSTSAQVITAPSGTDGYSPVNVAAVTAAIDNNIVASNIVSGVTILGVSGSATTLNGTTLSVTPSTSAQTITPTSPNNGFTEVSVSAVTSSIDANITAGNIKKDVVILGVTGSYEGEGSSGRYKLLDRIKDDSNNEIGTVCGFFTDANDVEYAVVCLDAQYRLSSAAWSSTASTVTSLTLYNMNGAVSDLITNKYTDTATSNCDKILAWCNANNYTSASVSHCRSKSFIIGGTTYYGQLPNLCELFYICANRTEISDADTSKSSYSSLDIATLATRTFSSSQASAFNAWVIFADGSVTTSSKTTGMFIIPVLEIPNT